MRTHWQNTRETFRNHLGVATDQSARPRAWEVGAAGRTISADDNKNDQDDCSDLHVSEHVDKSFR